MGRVNTEIIKISKYNPEKRKINKAATVLQNGGTVAFPTETVYGLGANALSSTAVEGIFRAKGRPKDNPLIVHISDISQIDNLVESIPLKSLELMERFWPGPLTIIFNKRENVPNIVTGGLSTVAIRMPNHKIALELIRAAGLPIAAPSANASGKPSPTHVNHVIEDMNGRVNMIIDGGITGIGVESTVLDVSGDIPIILRPGGVTKEDLLEVFTKVEYDLALESNNENMIPKSPGQKYRHYSPNAKMVVFQGEADNVSNAINESAKEYSHKGMKVGIMATEQNRDKYQGNVIVIGDRENPESIAGNLFRTLREFDKMAVDIILAEGIKEDGIGKAIMNRMKKAASDNVIVTGGTQ